MLSGKSKNIYFTINTISLIKSTTERGITFINSFYKEVTEKLHSDICHNGATADIAL